MRAKTYIFSGILIIATMLITFLLPMKLSNSASINGTNTIIIDAGHGGFDGGVVSENGDKESDINLAIAKILKSKMEEYGVRVIMTREGEGALGKTKKEDMARRREIIEESDADMVVSIHTNKWKGSERRGVQVFYDDTKKWEKEGIIMQRVMNEYVNKRYAKRSDISALCGDYFMTKQGNKPSLIIECGFISNREDATLLMDRGYRNDLADAIRVGIMTILEY